MIILCDIETSGLHACRDRIIEVAAVAVSDDLAEEAGRIVVTLEAGDLSTWDPWSVETHGKSGLVGRCQAAGVSVAEAERQLVEWLQSMPAPADGKGHQFGGSNVHFDRAFLRAQMPRFDLLFHHGGHLDAAVLRQALKSWRPDLPAWQPGPKAHEALADILGTLAELRFYRTTMQGLRS